MSPSQLEALEVHIDAPSFQINKNSQVRHLQEACPHKEMKETRIVTAGMGTALATKPARLTQPKTARQKTFLSPKIKTSRLAVCSRFSNAKIIILSARLTPKSRL